MDAALQKTHRIGIHCYLTIPNYWLWHYYILEMWTNVHVTCFQSFPTFICLVIVIFASFGIHASIHTQSLFCLIYGSSFPLKNFTQCECKHNDQLILCNCYRIYQSCNWHKREMKNLTVLLCWCEICGMVQQLRRGEEEEIGRGKLLFLHKGWLEAKEIHHTPLVCGRVHNSAAVRASILYRKWLLR